MTAPRWTLAEREAALEDAAREPVDVLVIGGGITGAAVLREAASRGLRTLLVERRDFASGTSSRSSKMAHGGLRYLAEGQLRVTAEACRERDRLMALHPNLVRSTPFLFPAFRGWTVRPWKIRAAMWTYAALACFRRSARFRMLDAEEVAAFTPDLRREGFLAAAVYHDGQVDDARLVLETLRSARDLGAEAVNHAEAVEILHAGGRVAGAGIRDALTGRRFTVRAAAVVNAAGPAAERVQGLDHFHATRRMRPAKGVHLVLRGDRVRARGTVTFEAPDGRHLFWAPWDDVALLGTTDEFTEEIDEPVVTIEEVHYLLEAANAAFPTVTLTTNDIVSVFAGVRPLAAPDEADTPSAAVSRDHRIDEHASGLVSVVGGKLTTHRAMGEAIVDRLLPNLPEPRRRAAGPSRTARLALRDDRIDTGALAADLAGRFGLDPLPARHLVHQYGRDAETLLAEAPPEQRGRIGTSRFTWAEIPWCFATECVTSLCDLLEHRVRMAIFAPGQGLAELPAIARLAAASAGWCEERTAAEMQAYGDRVRGHYQIVAPGRTRRLRASAA